MRQQGVPTSGKDSFTMSLCRAAVLDGENLTPVPSRSRLADLADLGHVDIETSPIVSDLSGDLHAIFDPVSDAALPIYFGPLLGRLYLEGL